MNTLLLVIAILVASLLFLISLPFLLLLSYPKRFEVDATRGRMYVWYEGDIIDSESFSYYDTKEQLLAKKIKLLQRADSKIVKIKELRKRVKNI